MKGAGRRVAITGYGVVAPSGIGKKAFWDGLNGPAITDSRSIEIEGHLVEAAEQLAGDFDLPVEFVCGSFIPKSAQVCSEAGNGFAWLVTDKGNTEEELGLAMDDFGVIFAYPWPDEERLIGNLFERYAAVGAVLVTHHGGQEFRLRRKT